MARDTEIVITLPGGRRVDAQVGHHLIHTDQPEDNGGEDKAPSPFQLFLAALGTCAGIFVQGFCASRGLDSAGIRILEHLEYDDEGRLCCASFDLRLPPEFPEKYRTALMRTVEQCSVKRAIQGGLDFRVTSTREPAPGLPAREAAALLR